MKMGYGLLILAVFLCSATHADVNMADRYRLPPSKVYLETCQRAALFAHPGVIKEQRVLYRYDHFGVRYQIQVNDGSEWFVLCDLASGNIIREQKWLDDGF